MSDGEKWFVSCAMLGLILLAVLVLVASIGHFNAFSDCVAYGNKPADCQVALD